MSIVPEAGVISFARGVPSPDMFALDALAECARRAVERHGRVALNYGPPGGYPPLREWIAERHDVPPGRVVLTPGSLIALNFVLDHLVARGDRAVVEAPTYDRALEALSRRGADVVAVERGPHGLDLERLRAILAERPRPRILYVLPTFHNPTGRTMGLDERDALARLVAEHGVVVLEDDPYGMLRFDGDPQPSVHELVRALGRDDLTVFASSFSKTVAPGLRVGYVVLPERLVAPVEALATRAYVSPPILPQAQLLEFLGAGFLEPHLEFLRSFLRDRRDALLAAFDERMPPGARWTRPDGGYFLWLEFPGAVGEQVDRLARERGVTVVPGVRFFAGGEGAGAARIAFSHPGVDEIREGAARLADAVERALEATSGAGRARRPGTLGS